jgi:hypothetical protein
LGLRLLVSAYWALHRADVGAGAFLTAWVASVAAIWWGLLG